MEKLITRWTRFFRNSRSVIVAKRGGHIVKKCPEKEQKRESEKKKWKPKSKFGKRRRINGKRFVSSKKIWQSGNH